MNFIKLFFLMVFISLAFLATGCSTVVPVSAKFPKPPGRGAMTPCPALQKLTDDAQLSDVARTVTINYSTYYECAVRAETWQEWYQIQKIIFEGAGR